MRSECTLSISFMRCSVQLMIALLCIRTKLDHTVYHFEKSRNDIHE
jgi:hypothetical protein